MTALVLSVLLAALQDQKPNLETSDGFYCATAHYLAYDTLLHESSAAHLLHVVSLDDPAGTRAELTIEAAAEPARRIRCEASRVTLQGNTSATTVALDLSKWTGTRVTSDPGDRRGGTGRWQT